MYFISETSMLMAINRTQSIMAFFSIGYIHRIQYQVECFYKVNSPQNFTSFNSSIVPSSKILSTSQPSNTAQGCNHWSSTESRTLILSYQEDAKASQKPLEKKAIWQPILQAFKESCQDKAIESEEILTQLKEKWNSPVENYKKIKDNNKATRRECESFKFLEELDSILGCRDKISPRYTCKTDICTDNPDKDSSTGDLTSPSTRGRSSNSDGEDCAEVDNDKATQVKILEALSKKAEKCTADKKQ